MSEAPAKPNLPEFSVSEIAGLLKRTVEDAFPFVRVRGEVSGLKFASSGHVYFDLKDDKAVLNAIIWKQTARLLKLRPEQGLEVVCTGRITTYPGSSRYQIVVEQIELAGRGALMALLEERKKKLAAEGLFDPARKKNLPFLPEVIGVVTSPTGAVIRDIMHRLNDRFPRRVLLWPVPVQGERAAAEVAAAIAGFNAFAPGGRLPRPDVLIVARGGGSIEDLMAFNEEIVVRAAAQSAIALISADGHETDTTLTDHAADRRAPTPTAAAEMAVPVLRELSATLDEYRLRLGKCAHRPLTLGRERLDARLLRIPRPETLVAQKAQKLDDAAERLRRGLADRAAMARHLLQDDRHRLSAPLLQANLRNAAQRLAALERVMRSLDPDSVLQRGYARVTDAAGRTLTTAADAGKEPALTLRFRDGRLDVTPNTAARKRSTAPKTAGEQPKLL